jgi:O-antigen ligase
MRSRPSGQPAPSGRFGSGVGPSSGQGNNVSPPGTIPPANPAAPPASGGNFKNIPFLTGFSPGRPVGLLSQQRPEPDATHRTAVVRVAPANAAQQMGFVALCIFLWILYGRFFDLFLAGLRIPLAISVAAGLFTVVAGRLGRVFTSTVTNCFLGFTLWACASVPFSIWRGGSFQILTEEFLKAVMVYGLLVTLVSSLDQAVRAMQVVAFSILQLAGMALAFGVLLVGRLMLPNGFYTNPNDLGYAMLLGVLMCWFVAHNRDFTKVLRGLAAIGILVMLYVLMRTGSRGAYLGLAVTIPMMFAFYSMAGRARFVALGTVMFLGLVVVAPRAVLVRFDSDTEVAANSGDAALQEMAEGSLDSRLYLLTESIAVTMKHPVFGVGLGNFEVAENDDAKSTGARGNWHGTHNTYTQISSEMGVPPLLMWLAAMGICWRQLRRVTKLNRTKRHPRANTIECASFGLQMALVGYSVLFATAHIAYLPLFYTLAGLIVVFTQHALEELESLPDAVPQQPQSQARPSWAISSPALTRS